MKSAYSVLTGCYSGITGGVHRIVGITFGAIGKLLSLFENGTIARAVGSVFASALAVIS